MRPIATIVKSSALDCCHCSRNGARVDGMTTTSAPRTARERARAELTSEIKAVARRQLAEQGCGRAVAAGRRPRAGHGVLGGLPLLPQPRRAAHRADHRRLRRGRPTRPSAAEPRCARADLVGRWMATCRAVRTWARGQPARVRAHLRQPHPRLRGAAGHDRPGRPRSRPCCWRSCRSPSAPVGPWPSSGSRCPGRSGATSPRSAGRPRRRSTTWPGPGHHRLDARSSATISFELFGHLHNVIHDYDAHFDFEMLAMAHTLGLDA